MGLFGKIFSTPVRIVNAPAKALENLIAGEDVKKGDRLISAPLEELAKELEKVDGDDED